MSIPSTASPLTRWLRLIRYGLPLHLLPLEHPIANRRIPVTGAGSARSTGPAWLIPAYQRRLAAGDRWADEHGLRPRVRQ